MSLIQPDRYFSRTSAINVEWDIVGKGFTHVLLDIDIIRYPPMCVSGWRAFALLA